MNRDYSDGIKNDIVFFTGVEVENTPFKGMKTLFVASDKIHSDTLVELMRKHQCEHIYLGANHCLQKHKELSEDFCDHLLFMLWYGAKVTLDVSVANFDLSTLSEEVRAHPNFNLTLAVRIPNENSFRNVSIKIDDTDFEATNEGVWVLSKQAFKENSESFTSWDAYKKDETL